MPLSLRCPASGIILKLPTINSPLTISQLHPLTCLPLDSLSRLFATETPSNHLELHAMLAGILIHSGCIFSSPLPVFPPEFYFTRLPEFLSIAQKIQRITTSWPTLHISSTTNRLNLENWLDECKGILDSHIQLGRRAAQHDAEVEQLIQYIWHTPQIKARKDWLNKSLKSAPLLGLSTALDTSTNPTAYPSRSIKAAKAYLLEFCSIQNEHDSFMLQGILAAMDAAIINNAKLNALMGIRSDAPSFEELDSLQLTTHRKNESGLAELRATLELADAIEESYKLNSNEPMPLEKDYKSKTSYQIALAGWQAKQSIKLEG